MLPEIAHAENLANDLISPNAINWDELNRLYNLLGKKYCLAQIEKERQGANNIYLSHLSLAEKAINQLP